MENPVLTSLREKRIKVINFIKYIDNSLSHCNTTNIDIRFESYRFRLKRFSHLEMKGVEMNAIARAIRTESINQLDRLNKEIERYEKGLNTGQD